MKCPRCGKNMAEMFLDRNSPMGVCKDDWRRDTGCNWQHMGWRCSCGERIHDPRRPPNLNKIR
jgi:hypothetical protein